ncbi:MAG: T9SS type A sorting domain-containing protein, partial [Sphingobacteriales bacterium]
ADLFWAYSRINHQLVNGQGTIAMLTFTIPANATPGQVIDLTFSDTRMVDNNLTELTGYNEVNSTITISTTSVNNVPGLVDFAEVVPNPSGNTATLQLNMQVAESTSLSITDMTGRKVYSRNLDLDKGWNAIALPASELSSGIYMIRLGEQRGSQCVKWIKN